MYLLLIHLQNLLPIHSNIDIPLVSLFSLATFLVLLQHFCAHLPWLLCGLIHSSGLGVGHSGMSLQHFYPRISSLLLSPILGSLLPEFLHVVETTGFSLLPVTYSFHSSNGIVVNMWLASWRLHFPTHVGVTTWLGFAKWMKVEAM